MLKIDHLVKSFGNEKILNDVSFEVPENRIVALLGPNGAGKTSIVKLSLGLLWPDLGEITISEGSWLDNKVRKDISYLPERFNFYPTYKITDVLEFYLKMNLFNGDYKQKSIELLTKVGLKDHLKKRVSQLSKGQLQRVAIATCMLPSKKFIILDEPFSGLDPFGIAELKEWIQEWKNEGKNILINSHLIGEISNIIDYVVIINEGVLCETIDLKARNDIVLDEYFLKVIREKRNDSI